MFSFKQKSEDHISRTEPGYEEGERHTPWTGVVLLIIMFVAGLVFGWRAVDDLARVPARPSDLSVCARVYAPTNYSGTSVAPSPLSAPLPKDLIPDYRVGPWWDSSEEMSCGEFNDLEIGAGVPELDSKRRDILLSLSKDEDALRQNYLVANQNAQSLQEQYSIRLQERQSGVPTISDEALTALRNSMEEAVQKSDMLAKTLQDKITSDRVNSTELKAVDQDLRAAYATVYPEQQRRQRLYEFKVFLLQIIFILPAFLLALALYLKQIRKNSPYAIIATAIVGVMGVLLLRVLLVWFWDLFLAELIQTIWQWIQNFELLRSIVFYLGMVLSFAIFGGAVYYLQKRIFDPRRVAIRRFRQNQCPQCQTSLDLANEFCPNCGHRIREQCTVCQKNRFVELPHCPHCGNRAESKS